MREIPLTQGLVAFVDDADFDWLSEFSWCAGRHPRGLYAIRSFDGRTTSMHRLITGYRITDHRDGNGLNNQRVNLRSATHNENMRNRRKVARTASNFKGLTRDHGKWRASIRVNGKAIYLGSYEREVDAALAYDAGARLHHGPFAALNFPRAGERSALVSSERDQQ